MQKAFVFKGLNLVVIHSIKVLALLCSTVFWSKLIEDQNMKTKVRMTYDLIDPGLYIKADSMYTIFVHFVLVIKLRGFIKGVSVDVSFL